MAKILEPNKDNISKAIAQLRDGFAIGMPTETVYGLAGDARNEKAIANIFATKGRPQFNPLISHISSFEMAYENGVFSPLAEKLAEHLWPGPFTIVVPRNPKSPVCDLACAGLETIALRYPKHEVALEIIKEFNAPIAAPSANISGRISPTNAQDVAIELGDRIAIIIDGGQCEIGLESTVVAVENDEITLLRKGFFTQSDIEKVLGKKIAIADAQQPDKPMSPGMLLRHYSPNAKVRLNSSHKQNGEIQIGFGNMDCDFNLSQDENLTEAAANLYKMLRMADAQNPQAIIIAPIPNNGLGEAINDRLQRAASN